MIAEAPQKKSASSRLPRIALFGNPNTGKSTIFNQLTGLRQRIANYPGITVEMHLGRCRINGAPVEILDLPGTYSLSATSPDERVVIEILTGQSGKPPPDVIVCILDATNLRRNLFLASQLAEYSLPMVLVLNQWDEARRRGIAPDPDALEEILGVRVVPTVGIKGEGLDTLREAIAEALEHPRRMRRIEWHPAVQQATAKLLEVSNGTFSPAEVQRLIFDSDSSLKNRRPELRPQIDDLIHQARELVRHESGLNPYAAEAILHYSHLDRILGRVLNDSQRALNRQADETIDSLLVHRFWGSVIFVAIMTVIFQSVYAWAAPFMALFENFTAWLQALAAPPLAAFPHFQSLVVDGIIAGVGSVIVFLPQIFILFFFIALLEDSGYMGRAAFLMDKLFGWCGLNGKSFVPLLSSFACAIPGILATRALEDPKARITTVLMAPFMSCSARLPVYILLIGAFIEPSFGPVVAGWTLLGMHFVGLALSLPFAWIFNRLMFRIPNQPFILEMTSYKIPHLPNVLLRMWEGGREFLLRAGTVILAFSVIIWALLYFPRSAEISEQTTARFITETVATTGLSESEVRELLNDPESELSSELEHSLQSAWVSHSYLGTLGKAVQPLFAPAGFDWKITLGILASFPAREVIIATLGIIYNLGSEVDEESVGLRDRLAAEVWTEGPHAGQPVFTLPTVFALMVFFALCMQCGSTVAVIGRQIGWPWAIGSFVFMTTLAWAAAVVIYQLGSRISL